MISVNLLAEIIGDNIYGDITLNENSVIYSIEELVGTCDQNALCIVERSINIYELAYKCKEWAMANKYHIFSKIKENGGMASLMWNQDICDLTTEYFYEESEVEAIFKACEHIIKGL